MRRLDALACVALAIGLAVGLVGCADDENASLVAKPDLAGFAVTGVDTANIANNGELQVALAVTDSKGGTNYSADQLRIRVWETPVSGEKMLVYDSKTVAAAPGVAGAPAAPKKPEKLDAPPINLAMVLDRSGSMNASEQGNMQDAALGLLDYFRLGDQVEVINVSTEVNVDATFRDFNAKPIERAITTPSVRRGWTKIYDGVLRGIFDSDHAKTFDIRRAVFVVTDGQDNRSDASLDSLIASAQSESVPVFVVGLADSSDPTDLDAAGLGRLALETSGRFVTTYSSLYFEAIMAALSRSLTSEVVFSYESPLGDAPRTATIEVTVGDEDPTTTEVKIAP